MMKEWKTPEESTLRIGDYWFVLKGEDTPDVGMFMKHSFVTADGIAHPVEDVELCMPVTPDQKKTGTPKDQTDIAFVSPQYACIVLGTYYENLDEYYKDETGASVILFDGYDFLDEVEPFVKWDEVEEWYAIPEVSKGGHPIKEARETPNAIARKIVRKLRREGKVEVEDNAYLIYGWKLREELDDSEKLPEGFEDDNLYWWNGRAIEDVYWFGINDITSLESIRNLEPRVIAYNWYCE